MSRTSDLMGVDLLTGAGLPPETPKVKKDHKCPHDRKHQSGMEVCRKCGDYRICETCGMEYIWQDSGDRFCWMCLEVVGLTAMLDAKRDDQRNRIAKFKQPATA